jgi:hypothetical protein
MRTNIRVEQELAIVAKCSIAMRATLVHELKVPRFPTFWATVMWDNLDLAVNDVSLKG